jgi:hypothetical protein
MCKCHRPTKQCQLTYKKIEEKAMKKHEFTLAKYKTLHLSLTMDAQAFWMASWDAILSPSLVQLGRWIPMGSTNWTQMQWVILKARRWGRPNLIHNTEEKTPKDNQKHKMIRQANTNSWTLVYNSSMLSQHQVQTKIGGIDAFFDLVTSLFSCAIWGHAEHQSHPLKPKKLKFKTRGFRFFQFFW